MLTSFLFFLASALANGDQQPAVKSSSVAPQTAKALATAVKTISPAKNKKHAPCSVSRLLAGHALQPDPMLYHIRRPWNSYGTTTMLETIVQAADEVAWLAPHADPIVIGDISRKGGGSLRPHKSHRGGADVDIGIFYDNGKQSAGFKTVTRHNFDHETNWIFVRHLLNSGNVERILLDQSLVNELRNYVIAKGELSKEEAHRVFPPRHEGRLWLRSGVVHHVSGHKNHYHVRVFCGNKAVN